MTSVTESRTQGGGSPAGHGHHAPDGELLPLEEALARMLAGLEPLDPDDVELDRAAGRVLAEPIVARAALPPWDNSAMDGFAVRADDVRSASERAVRLRVVADVAAGSLPTVTVGPGTCARVLTGGIVPAGADTVVPVEDTDATAGHANVPAWVEVHRSPALGAHIRRAGSDVAPGSRLLEVGALVRPAVVGLLAATGHASVRVHRAPRVAVLSTGDELEAVGRPLGPASIHDSNGPMLAAQVRAAGGDVQVLPAARDELDDVLGRLRQALAFADVIVVSGGVSVGARDVVKEAFAAVGQLDLWRVAVQPGKPLAFGRAARPDGREVLLFGLPGNPVSSFVTLELFVRPVLRRLAGHRDPAGRATLRAVLAERVVKDPRRRAFLRVRLATDPDRRGRLTARLAGGQGSHVLSALVHADALAIVPEGIESLPEGTEVEVWPLDEGAV